MKQRSLFLVGFLLVLYIVPMIYTSSYGHATIPTEQTMSKDFTPSALGDPSPYSITSFSETLPPNVGLYQTTIHNTTEISAYDGTGNYANSIVLDSVFWTAEVWSTANFQYWNDAVNVSGFTYQCYGKEVWATGSSALEYYNGDDWIELDTFTTSFAWYNDTVIYQNSDNIVQLRITTNLHDTMIQVDFLSITIMYLKTSALFYPDAIHNTTEISAYDGDDDYADSIVLDSVTWDTAVEEEAHFGFFDSNVTVEGFTYQCYGKETNPTGDSVLEYYDGDDWIELDTFTTSFAWHNDTKYISGLDEKNIVYLRINTDFSDTVIQVDFLSITIIYLTLSSDIHYSDSFADVSDWSEQGIDGGDSFTSDGDVGTIELVYDSGARDYKGYYTNAPNFNDLIGYNIEVRIKKDTNDVETYVTFYQTDEVSGDRSVDDITPTTAWQTFKVAGDSDPLECIYIGATLDNGESVTIDIEYLRVGSSTEMGWQHDGSMTEGVENEGSADWAFGCSSNGDILSLTWDREATATDTGAWQQINIDDTSTSAEIELDYYPLWMLRWRVTESTNASLSNLQVYTDDTRLALASITSVDETTSWSTMRYNMLASTDTGVAGNSIRFYCGNSEDTATLTLEIELTKFYSIANFTLGGSDLTTSDVMYVNEGSLIMDNAGGCEYSWIQNDADIAVSKASYPVWNISCVQDTSYIRLREISTNNYWHDLGDMGGFVFSSTLKTFRIYNWADAVSNITVSAISFFSIIPEWRVVTNVDFVFFVGDWHIINSIVIIFATEISTYTINLLLLFLGLAMIPLSTIYLVKGGRSEMSMDKVFFGIVIFILGWALFLGGIFV